MEKSAQEKLAEIELAKIQKAEANKKLSKKIALYGVLPIIIFIIIFNVVEKFSINKANANKDKIFTAKTNIVNDFCYLSLDSLNIKYGKPKSYSNGLTLVYNLKKPYNTSRVKIFLTKKNGKRKEVHFNFMKIQASHKFIAYAFKGHLPKLKKTLDDGTKVYKNFTTYSEKKSNIKQVTFFPIDMVIVFFNF